MIVRIFVSTLQLLAVSLTALPAFAQLLPPIEVTAPDARKLDSTTTTTEPAKPEIIIGGPAPRPAGNIERCVDVEIGGARSFGCINQSLKHGVEKVNPSLNLPPIDARSADTKLGIVNLPAVQQQYGQNYGRSVVPFRPPQPSFGGVTPRR